MLGENPSTTEGPLSELEFYLEPGQQFQIVRNCQFLPNGTVLTFVDTDIETEEIEALIFKDETGATHTCYNPEKWGIIKLL